MNSIEIYILGDTRPNRFISCPYNRMYDGMNIGGKQRWLIYIEQAVIIADHFMKYNMEEKIRMKSMKSTVVPNVKTFSL